MWSAPAAIAAATVPSTLPSSTMSHSTQSKPSMCRGSSESVVPMVASSLRHGIWMTSFRRATGSVPLSSALSGRDARVVSAAPKRLLVSLEAFIAPSSPSSSPPLTRKASQAPAGAYPKLRRRYVCRHNVTVYWHGFAGVSVVRARGLHLRHDRLEPRFPRFIGRHDEQPIG